MVYCRTRRLQKSMVCMQFFSGTSGHHTSQPTGLPCLSTSSEKLPLRHFAPFAPFTVTLVSFLKIYAVVQSRGRVSVSLISFWKTSPRMEVVWKQNYFT